MAASQQPYPFVAFNFSVELTRDGKVLCGAQFSECDGLEVTMDVKTIREGGNNDAQIRLAGPHSFGTLTLKRGMTAASDLWDWVSSSVNNPGQRLDARVVIYTADVAPKGARELARFELSGCLPQRMKAPSLNAKDGMVAVEELQVVYQSLKFVPKQQGGT